MPFPRNVIQPEKVQQGLPRNKEEDEESSLQHFANFALVNIIRQLASLHSKVDIVFGHLLAEGEDLHKRLQEVKTKLIKIDKKVQDMDSNTEVIGRALGKDRKAVYKRIAERSNYFQSEQRLDSGLFMEESSPQEVKLLYQRADPMPRLHDLDKYREDGKYGAKFYSNPEVFFLAWQETLQQIISEQHAKSLMKSKRTVRQTNIRRVRKAKASRIIEAQKLKMGIELASHSPLLDVDEEYFSDEEWSDTDDDDDDVLLSPNRAALIQNNIHGAQNSALSVKTHHYRLSSFGEYKIENLEHTKLTIDTHSPPVSTIEEFSLNNHNGDAREFPLQFSLDSMSISKWEDSTDKT